MRTHIVFSTDRHDIISLLQKKKLSLIPADTRTNGFATFSGSEIVISTYQVGHGSTVGDFVTYMRSLITSDVSGVIVLTDNSLFGLVDILGDVFSVNVFQPPAYDRDASNAIKSILAKCLRTFRNFKMRFEDAKYHQILRIPLRNFRAQEAHRMREACRDMMNRENFGRELDYILRDLRQRQRPKKSSTYKDIYLVDDEEKHFSLGKEMHARAETTCPPHNDICVAANQFRFGCAFDGTRHFNVSHEGQRRMDSEYADCHGESRPGKGVTHLNMFTNDFFEERAGEYSVPPPP